MMNLLTLAMGILRYLTTLASCFLSSFAVVTDLLIDVLLSMGFRSSIVVWLRARRHQVAIVAAFVSLMWALSISVCPLSASVCV